MKIKGIRHKVRKHRPDLRSACDLLESMQYNGFCDLIARHLAYIEANWGWDVWELILSTADEVKTESGTRERGMLIKGAIIGFLIARGKIK